MTKAIGALQRFTDPFLALRAPDRCTGWTLPLIGPVEDGNRFMLSSKHSPKPDRTIRYGFGKKTYNKIEKDISLK